MRDLFVQQCRSCLPLCERANICAYFVSFIMDFVPFLPYYSQTLMIMKFNLNFVQYNQRRHLKETMLLYIDVKIEQLYIEKSYNHSLIITHYGRRSVGNSGRIFPFSPKICSAARARACPARGSSPSLASSLTTGARRSSLRI